MWKQGSGGNWEVRVNGKRELIILGKRNRKYEVKGEIPRVVY